MTDFQFRYVSNGCPCPSCRRFDGRMLSEREAMEIMPPRAKGCRAYLVEVATGDTDGRREEL